MAFSLRKRSFALLIIVLFVFVGSALAKKKAHNPIVAKIGKKSIRLKDFQTRYQMAMQSIHGEQFTKEEVLKNMVYFELAVQEAKKKGFHKKKELQKQFDTLLYQAVVNQALQRKLDKIKIEEKQIKNYYERNPLLKTSHLVLLVKATMEADEIDDLKKKAEEMQKEIASGDESFEDMVKKYSDDPNANMGGDLGWGARHRLLPEYYNAALMLKKIGDVSKVVQSIYGFHIIKLTGRKPYKEIEPDYKIFIERLLREKKKSQVLADYFGSLLKKSRAKIYYKLLK